jgi:polysaccharide pyruvyl transferase WcaK-like protein
VTPSNSEQTKPDVPPFVRPTEFDASDDFLAPRVCILGAGFNTKNMGVSMLAAGAIRCVLHRFPRARVTMLDYAYEGYDFDFLHNGIQARVRFVNLRFSKKFYLANNVALLILLVLIFRLIPSAALRRRLLSRNRYVREVLETDIFFAVSGGDSFSDIYGVGRFFYVALPQLLALFARKRLILLPQTIGPFRGRVVCAIAAYIMKRAEVVYSRDYVGVDVSRRLLGLRNGDGKVRFCHDMAFDVDPLPPARLEIDGLPDTADAASSLAGFNVSGLLFSGGYTRDNMFRLSVDYEELVGRMIEFLIEQKSAHVLLIPHVFGSGASIESDVRACQTVFSRLREKYAEKLGLLRGEYSYDQLKYVIGRCDFFTGARMHACIGAISQCVPTVPLAYSDKFAGMMEAIGFGDLVADPRRMNAEEILQILNQVYEKRHMIRSRLAVKIPAVKHSIRTALDAVP